ncbi:MAG TPA: DUF3649 domain-containing protein [Pusillimonas sp.]
MKTNTRLRYRLEVASRALAAICGGYALTATASGLLALTLPMQRADAVLTATLLSFTLYACAALWAFAAGSALRAWLGIGVPTIVCTLGILACRSLT